MEFSFFTSVNYVNVEQILKLPDTLYTKKILSEKHLLVLNATFAIRTTKSNGDSILIFSLDWFI